MLLKLPNDVLQLLPTYTSEPEQFLALTLTCRSLHTVFATHRAAHLWIERYATRTPRHGLFAVWLGNRYLVPVPLDVASTCAIPPRPLFPARNDGADDTQAITDPAQRTAAVLFTMQHIADFIRNALLTAPDPLPSAFFAALSAWLARYDAYWSATRWSWLSTHFSYDGWVVPFFRAALGGVRASRRARGIDPGADEDWLALRLDLRSKVNGFAQHNYETGETYVPDELESWE
ncbi:hypothetical protein RI367_002304 [Sorochytrium milnesiophthora]